MKYYRIIFLISFFLGQYSCSKNLDRFPLDSPSNVTFYTNAGELNLAINAVYNSLWFHDQGQQVLQRLDNTTDIGWLRGAPEGLSDGSATSSLSAFRSYWYRLYHGISKANNLLTNMKRAEGNVSIEEMSRYEAEARFLRAYYYHLLIELFGDVPLLIDVPSIEESFLPRSKKDDIVNFILEDLIFASNNLPIEWPNEEKGRATKGAALTLFARIALYTGRYDNAIQASKEVIELNQYSLYPDYGALFQYEGIRSNEVIFDVPYLQGISTHSHPRNAGSRITGSFSNIAPSQYLIDSYLTSEGLTINESPLYDTDNPFLNRDPRLDATIIRPQSEFAGFIFETHPDSTETWKIENNTKTERIPNQDVTNPFATFTGYLWRKYNSESDFPEKINASELNFILMRYAEVLLIYAEAKIEIGEVDQSVVEALNLIRARAYGVNPSQVNLYPEIQMQSQEELREILRNERKIELAYEGFRLFDIRRWRIADIVLNGPLLGRPLRSYGEINQPPMIDSQTGHPEYGTTIMQYRQVMPRSFKFPRDWLYPIPQDEINVNKSIEQNPGY